VLRRIYGPKREEMIGEKVVPVLNKAPCYEDIQGSRDMAPQFFTSALNWR
jgi:hypothetical protein